MISADEKAYQYADGPYKQIIGLLTEETRLYVDAHYLWIQELQCLEDGDKILVHRKSGNGKYNERGR